MGWLTKLLQKIIGNFLSVSAPARNLNVRFEKKQSYLFSTKNYREHIESCGLLRIRPGVIWKLPFSFTDPLLGGTLSNASDPILGLSHGTCLPTTSDDNQTRLQKKHYKHHHHGDGSACPSTGLGLIMGRWRGGRPVAYFFLMPSLWGFTRFIKLL